MKKMFFIAIVLVAFVGNSMANTKESKESFNLIKKNTKIIKKETKSTIIRVDCAGWAANWLDNYESSHGCLDTATYNAVYNNLIAIC